MCGIAGTVYRPGVAASLERLRAMCETIVHRGPDDDGMLIDGYVGLGMRRLAIIDLASGKQPIHNEDRTIWVVFNGEIYNYLDLRADLESRGHRFYTHSDTETLVHLYEEYGDRFVERLNGMFCFALWDSVRRRMLVARDRIGEKQLYYAWQNDALVFGSEIKCVLASGLVSREVDTEALDDYFRYLYILPPHTAYARIRELPPASLLVLEEGKEPVVSRYWRFDFRQRDCDTGSLADRVREQFRRSVRSRLVSDVPLGVLLSGGIDSSAVAAAMVEASTTPVRTFTIGYGEEGRVYDERDQAREFARLLGTEHAELVVSPDIVGVMPDLVRAFDQPFGDSSAVANYYAFRETRRHVKVVLTGLGGDEVFAGYERHLAMRVHALLQNLPRALRAGFLGGLVQRLPEPRNGGRWMDRLKRFARTAAASPSEAYRGYVTWFDDALRTRLYGPEMQQLARVRTMRYQQYFDEAGDDDEVNQALYADTLAYLPGDLLVLTDRMSMAHSVEARAPFIDPDLVTMVAAMPGDAKLRRFTKKHLLKDATRSMIPNDVLRRPKRGFTIPLTVWLRGELLPYVRARLSREAVERTGFLRWEAVNQLVEEHASRRQNHQARLWALLMFMEWHTQYIDRPAAA